MVLEVQAIKLILIIAIAEAIDQAPAGHWLAIAAAAVVEGWPGSEVTMGAAGVKSRLEERPPRRIGPGDLIRWVADRH